LDDLTERLTEEKRWEEGRLVEFVHPERGTRLGKILRTFVRGEKRAMLVIGLSNPYTGGYGNRGGFRTYNVLIEKERVVRFYRKV